MLYQLQPLVQCAEERGRMRRKGKQLVYRPSLDCYTDCLVKIPDWPSSRPDRPCCRSTDSYRSMRSPNLSSGERDVVAREALSNSGSESFWDNHNVRADRHFVPAPQPRPVLSSYRYRSWHSESFLSCRLPSVCTTTIASCLCLAVQQFFR